MKKLPQHSLSLYPSAKKLVKLIDPCHTTCRANKSQGNPEVNHQGLKSSAEPPLGAAEPLSGLTALG